MDGNKAMVFASLCETPPPACRPRQSPGARRDLESPPSVSSLVANEGRAPAEAKASPWWQTLQGPELYLAFHVSVL